MEGAWEKDDGSHVSQVGGRENLLSGVRILLDESINEKLGLLLGLLLIHIDQGDISTRVDHALRNNEAESAGTTGDKTDATVKCECAKSRLHVLTTSAMDGLAARELMLLRILHFDVTVGSRVAARLVLAGRHAVQVADACGGGGEGRTQGSSCRGCGCGCSASSVPQHGSEGGCHCESYVWLGDVKGG